jgi:hypothetical protein
VLSCDPQNLGDLVLETPWRMIAMKRIALTAIGLLFFSQSADASPSWVLISFTTTAQNVPELLAAADELMASEAGKDFPGRLLLQRHVADGANPATHSFVPIYKTAAQREAFAQKLQADPAWDEFMETMTKVSHPVSQVLHRTLKSWGEIVDTDQVWAGHAFDVSDPAAFLAALDKLMASETFKKFPGQVHLSSVVAGGITPVSHTISVGYASEAEMEAWAESLVGNADWRAFVDESNVSAQYLGNNLVRDVKAWGPASLDELTAR